MNGAVMTIAKYFAREAVKRELRAQAIKLQTVEASELSRAANDYLTNHPELIEFATERYQDFVKRSLAQRQSNRRKTSQ